jgi:mono/diheme cytochrome c family protein
MLRVRRPLRLAVVTVLAVLVVIQLVPYGRSHANPAPTRAARLPDGPGKQLFAGACADCHSDQTTWPWYSNVAPVSWLVQNDVDGGRDHFDVSRWDQPQPGVDEVVGQVEGKGMPPLQYKVIHSGGRLSSSERAQLADWLRRLYASDPPAATRGGD